MVSSQKTVVLCLFVLLSTFGVLVDAGQGLMGLFGGGKGHGSHGAIETLLVAGILASLLRKSKKNQGHSHGHGHGHGHGHSHGLIQGHGGYASEGIHLALQQAYAQQLYAQQAYVPYHYGLAYQHGFGF